MGPFAIEVEGVSKAYRLYPTPRHRALEVLTFGTRQYHTSFWALTDVSFQLEAGATLGLIGNNGSGKSTLLQVISGIVPPTTGRVGVNGRISSLLELGAGFNPEFSGRENVELYGIVMGMSREETAARLPAIEAFAGIGDFIERPVKSYSSGMFVRLAFSAAIHVNPDILLVDEALAVGDVIFQHQCISRIREMQADGTTIIFVSHDMAMVRSICTEAILLESGRIAAHDDAATIANVYHAKTSAKYAAMTSGRAPEPDEGDAASGSPTATFHAAGDFDERIGLFRHGSGGARIRDVELLDKDGRPVTSVDFDEEVTLRVHVQYHKHAPFSILGFSIRDKTGTDIVGTNTHEENVPLPPRRRGDTVVVDFRQRLPLAPGTYSVSTALAYDRSKPNYFDWVDNALVLKVLPPESGKIIHAKVGLPVDIVVHAP
jgi:ABC-type polysaccharide/polyol phosphate transport system ATPase subunit